MLNKEFNCDTGGELVNILTDHFVTDLCLEPFKGMIEWVHNFPYDFSNLVCEQASRSSFVPLVHFGLTRIVNFSNSIKTPSSCSVIIALVFALGKVEGKTRRRGSLFGHSYINLAWEFAFSNAG